MKFSDIVGFGRACKKGGFTLVRIMVVCAFIGLIAALALSARAQLAGQSVIPQSGQPNFFNLDANTTSFTLTNNQTQTFTAGGTNTYIKTIRQNQGVSLFLAVWQTNSVASTTTNFTVGIDVTGDGLTWTRGAGAYPITWTVSLAGQGASTNVFWTNLSATALSNIRKAQVTKVSTTASNNIFGSFGWSQSTQ